MATVASHEMGPLLVLSVLLLAGLGGGAVARKLRAPGVTGNIVVGALLGATLLRHIDAAKALQPLSTFAIGLIAVAAGGHLSYRRIHNALRRILVIALFEAACAAALVFCAATALGAGWRVSLLLAALAAETAPATTVAMIKETRAKGPFVKTLLGVVSVDTSLCIVLFAFARTAVADYFTSDGSTGLPLGFALIHTLWQLGGSLVIGLLIGWIIDRMVHRPRFHHFSAVFLAILMAEGLSNYLELSPLLTCLFFGVYLGNASRAGERQLNTLEPLELLLYTLFFTLAGVGLHLGELSAAGLLCAAYIVARIAGKALGGAVGGFLSGTSGRIWRNIPLGFVPQAGVAIGLVVILEGDARVPTEISSLVGTLILAAVTFNEIVGPFCTRFALQSARETGLDRPRLMEFLQEEFILPDLEAADKWEALEILTDFFIRTHPVEPKQRKQLYASIEERERSMSTAIGMGAAIPHGRVESGPGIQGVLGLCREGIEFDSPDGEPVRIIVLIVTPKDHEKQHLEVLASLSAMISNDTVRTRLIAAIDANDAWEVIEGGEARSYNYFLSEADGEAPERV
ncbi:MAG: PTS sugar transporter subunit IIA [Candidatus Hydrogenedentes bacterium]|nr:PTS sugar transporter subunit IIA [Candidatus Hydrogenedentota bacterium]